jgi:hypothetical protein
MFDARSRSCRLRFAAVAVVAFVLACPAQAAMSEAAVRKQIAETYNVQVLKVRPATIDGRAAFLVTVMKAGGNRNDAFQVSTLAIDRDTGKLLPSYRYGPSGVSGPEAPSYVPNRQPDNALEQGNTWR